METKTGVIDLRKNKDGDSMKEKQSGWKWEVGQSNLVKLNNGEEYDWQKRNVCQAHGDTPAEAKANAEYIVKAVNAYGDMLKLLKRFVTSAESLKVYNHSEQISEDLILEATNFLKAQSL